MYQHPFKATVVAGLVLLFLPRPAPAQIVGEGFSSTKLSCAGLKLETAWGMPDGAERKYEFGGSCRVYQSDGEGQQHDFPVIAEASWNSKTRRLEEGLKILGDFEYHDTHVAGSVQSIYLCSADPIIGPAACNGMQHDNQIDLDQFSQSFPGSQTAPRRPNYAGRGDQAEPEEGLATSAAAASRQAEAHRTRYPEAARAGDGNHHEAQAACGGLHFRRTPPIRGSAHAWRRAPATKRPSRRGPTGGQGAAVGHRGSGSSDPSPLPGGLEDVPHREPWRGG